MTVQATVSPYIRAKEGSERSLAYGVVLNAAKIIEDCPETVKIDDILLKRQARAKLKQALQALDWAVKKPETFVFWCEIADIGPEWMSERMIKLAESKPLLMMAWEAQQ